MQQQQQQLKQQQSLKQKELQVAAEAARRKKELAQQEEARAERQRFRVPYGTAQQEPGVASYHSSLSQVPFDAAVSNKETPRIRRAAESCKVSSQSVRQLSS